MGMLLDIWVLLQAKPPTRYLAHGDAQETVAGIAGIATGVEQSRNAETNAVDSLAQGNAGCLEGWTWGRGSECETQCRG